MVTIIVAVPLTAGTPILESTGKRVVFEVLGSVLSALVLSRATLRVGKERIGHFFLAGPHLPICLFLTCGIVSAFSSAYKLFSFIEFFHLALCVLIYYVCVYQLSRLRHMQLVCDALVLVAAVASLLALAQMASTRQEVVSGPFQNHMLLGSFLMLVFPLLLSICLFERGEPLRKVITQAVTLLTAIALLAARARSAWLGELISLVLLACLWFAYVRRTNIRLQELSRNKHLFMAPTVAVISVVAFIYFSQLGTVLSHRLHTFFQLGTDNAFQARLYIWHGVKSMIAVHPLFGWGIGTYSLYEPGFTRLDGNWAFELSLGPPHTNYAHSLYLQTLAEIGVLGLGLYTGVIITFFVSGLRALGLLENGIRKTILIASLSAAAGQVVDAAASPSYNFVPVNPFLWLFMGMGMSCAFSALGTDDPQKRDRPVKNTSISNRLAIVVRFPAAFLLILSLTAPLIRETNPVLPVSDTRPSAGGRFTISGVDNTGKSYSGTIRDEVVLAPTADSAKTVTLSTKFTDAHDNTSLVAPSGFRLTGDYQALVKEAHNSDGTFTVERTTNLATHPDVLLVTATFTDSRNNSYAVDYPIVVR